MVERPVPALDAGGPGGRRPLGLRSMKDTPLRQGHAYASGGRGRCALPRSPLTPPFRGVNRDPLPTERRCLRLPMVERPVSALDTGGPGGRRSLGLRSMKNTPLRQGRAYASGGRGRCALPRSPLTPPFRGRNRDPLPAERRCLLLPLVERPVPALDAGGPGSRRPLGLRSMKDTPQRRGRAYAFGGRGRCALPRSPLAPPFRGVNRCDGTNDKGRPPKEPALVIRSATRRPGATGRPFRRT